MWKTLLLASLVSAPIAHAHEANDVELAKTSLAYASAKNDELIAHGQTPAHPEAQPEADSPVLEKLLSVRAALVEAEASRRDLAAAITARDTQAQAVSFGKVCGKLGLARLRVTNARYLAARPDEGVYHPRLPDFDLLTYFIQVSARVVNCPT